MDTEPEFMGVILFCPLCNSTVDATGWGVHYYECSTCETSFDVDLDPEKVKKHSV